MIELLLQAESALSLGLLDRAEILYRQVAGADPLNSIAVVGLARVLLERGDEPGALKQARRALAIDAENTAAQRMVQRLEEVLEHRQREGSRAADGRAPAAPLVAVEAAPPPAAPSSDSGPESGAPEPWSPTPSVPAAAAAAPGAPDQGSPAIEPHRTRTFVDRLLRRR